MNDILALDIGDRRIGVARAHPEAKLPEPLITIDRKEVNAYDAIQKLIDEYHAQILVIGLPLGLSGNVTDQTKSVKRFVAELRSNVNIPIVYTDETLTTVSAENTAKDLPYAETDSLAACHILQNYFNAQKSGATNG